MMESHEINQEFAHCVLMAPNGLNDITSCNVTLIFDIFIYIKLIWESRDNKPVYAFLFYVLLSNIPCYIHFLYKLVYKGKCQNTLSLFQV